MKKSLVSALTTALVVGAASTTFAAANPFADVPADHWSYDAIAQLAADGVIEGYGDGTYRGDEEITRYEMAQMVARAMAKGSNANRALIDKLAAEFSEELNNLGVRVAALEKKVDNVKFSGELRYRTHHIMSKNGKGGRTAETSRSEVNSHTNELRFVLDMKATVNKNWTANARVLYNGDMRTSENVGGNKSNIRMDRAWAQGDYRNFTIKLGKFNWKSAVDNGMVNDDRVSGAMVTFGKKIKVDIMGGRYNLDDNAMWGGIDNYDALLNRADKAASVGAIQVYNDRKDKFTWGVGYTYVNAGVFLEDVTEEKDLNIINLGLGYKFNKNLRLDTAWARDMSSKNVRSAQKNRWYVELGYRGADRNKPGSYGLYLAYRELGPYGGLYSTYRSGNGTLPDNVRGIDLGGTVTIFKNVQATVKYFNGSNLHFRDDAKYGRFESIFGQVDFFF